MAKRGNNEGTIFRKANGSWRAQVSIGGKRLGHTARTRAECHEWLQTTLAQVGQGVTFEGQSMALGDYLRDWISSKKNALRLKTGLEYERLILLHVGPVLGKTKLKDLGLRSVAQFYDRLRSKGVGVSIVGHVHRVLHSAMEDAARRGILGRNPLHGARVPRLDHREMAMLNEQQVGSFLVAASTSRYRALYQLAIATGMRVSELRGLTWADMDWVRGTITVKRQIQNIPGRGSVSGAPKTHSGTRVILLGEMTLNELRRQKVSTEAEARACSTWAARDLIFPSAVGTAFGLRDMHKDFANVLRSANLPRIRFHDLRHTAASLMLSHGVPAVMVSRILGHANPSITLSIYAHSTLDMQDGAASVMDQIVTPIPVRLSALHPVAPGPKAR